MLLQRVQRVQRGASAAALLRANKQNSLLPFLNAAPLKNYVVKDLIYKLIRLNTVMGGVMMMGAGVMSSECAHTPDCKVVLWFFAHLLSSLYQKLYMLHCSSIRFCTFTKFLNRTQRYHFRSVCWTRTPQNSSAYPPASHDGQQACTDHINFERPAG
jgi:hypothetical protein